MNLKRLEIEVFFRKCYAIKLSQKQGFQIKGTVKDHACRAGEYVDICIMAQLEPESKINQPGRIYKRSFE
ncbi:hypothetical protein GF407_07045 [candidate division KSB1 bacterium]|nr:hypothetical protein [candidate division KSB1 bacterium]